MTFINNLAFLNVDSARAINSLFNLILKTLLTSPATLQEEDLLRADLRLVLPAGKPHFYQSINVKQPGRIPSTPPKHEAPN